MSILVAALVAAAPVSLTVPIPAYAAGIVRDVKQRTMVAGALVQQEGAPGATLSQKDGRFHLLLDPKGQPRLRISHPGYESKVVWIGTGAAMWVGLTPLTSYVPQPDVPEPPKPEPLPPLAPGLELAYRVRQAALTVGPSAVTGLANNDLRLTYRWRGGPWLLAGEGAHYQMPVNVPGLAREANPAFSPNTWTAGGLAGYAWQFASDIEVGGAASYRYQVTTPNNNGIPYTASALDFEQTRHALGAMLLGGWQAGPLRLEGRLGFHPLIVASARAPGTAFGGQNFSEARLAGYYRLMPGLSLGASYGYEMWTGDGTESGHLLGLQFHYAPELPVRQTP